MTNTAKLSANQIKTLMTVLPMMVTAEATEFSAAGEISAYAIAKAHGAAFTAIDALVRKGILIHRNGEMPIPEGPDAGMVSFQAWYSAA